MLLTDFFTDVYRPLRLRGKSDNSTRLYNCLLRQFTRHLLRPATVADLEELTLARYLDRRAAAGRSPYTVERERAGLMALARMAQQRGMLAMLPCCQQGVLPEATPEAWSMEQLGQLLREAEAMPGNVGPMPAGKFWPALLLTLWQTGERISAVMETPAENYRRPHLLVPATARKGRRRDRVYTLDDELCDRLDELRQPTGPLFPWPLCKTYLWDRMKRMVKRAGISDGRKFRFHGVRRSALSHYAAAGGDATAMADHSSPRMTSRWYLDPRIADRSPRPCDVLPRIDTRIIGQEPRPTA